MAEKHEGKCLCGAVRYRVVGNPTVSGVCHCTLCKRRTGSAFGMVAYFDESAVEIRGGNLKAYEYRSDESGRWLKLEFCPNCGTTVTATAEFAPGGRAILIGTFDDPNWIKPQAHFFTRSALHWVDLPVDVELFETIPSQTRED